MDSKFVPKPGCRHFYSAWLTMGVVQWLSFAVLAGMGLGLESCAPVPKSANAASSDTLLSNSEPQLDTQMKASPAILRVSRAFFDGKVRAELVVSPAQGQPRTFQGEVSWVDYP